MYAKLPNGQNQVVKKTQKAKKIANNGSITV